MSRYSEGSVLTHAAEHMQSNCITHMDGLSHLSVLLSLNLSNNRIVKIAAMSSLTMLRHLSLHGNQITSLTGAPLQYEIGPTAQTHLELQFVWNLTKCQCMDVCTHACFVVC